MGAVERKAMRDALEHAHAHNVPEEDDEYHRRNEAVAGTERNVSAIENWWVRTTL